MNIPLFLFSTSSFWMQPLAAMESMSSSCKKGPFHSSSFQSMDKLLHCPVNFSMTLKEALNAFTHLHLLCVHSFPHGATFVHTFFGLLCRKDYYDILQVSRGADESQIKRAYRKLALKYHPVRALSFGKISTILLRAHHHMLSALTFA